MSIVVEDGTGIADANSYASEDDFDTYTDDSGYVVTVGDTEAALIRATRSLDAKYRRRFPGTRVLGRDQGLEWPRQNAVDSEGNIIADDEIPIEIIDATCELALRELASPGSTMPDLERGGAVRRLQAGSVSVEYATSAPVTTTFSLIDGILAALLLPTSASSGLTSRG